MFKTPIPAEPALRAAAPQPGGNCVCATDTVHIFSMLPNAPQYRILCVMQNHIADIHENVINLRPHIFRAG
jgi:hypothetical protein